MFINKSHIFLLIISLSITSFSFAQNISWGAVIQEDLGGMQWQMARVGKVKLFFCNDGIAKEKLKKELTWINKRPWQKQDICMIIWNIGETKNTITVWFSSWVLNQAGQRICDQDMWADNNFSKLIYMPQSDNLNNIEIPLNPWETAVKKAYIYIPKTYSGNLMGCVSYRIKGDVSRGSWGIFDVVIRKIWKINITVSWSPYNYQRLDDLKENISFNKNGILKILIWIIWLRLIISVVQSLKHKKKKHHTHK
jgi:hypothetical protein